MYRSKKSAAGACRAMYQNWRGSVGSVECQRIDLQERYARIVDVILHCARDRG